MKSLLIPFAIVGIVINWNGSAIRAAEIPNRLIDYAGFRNIVIQSESERAGRRLTEDQFIRELNDPHVVILDARTDSKYALRHVKGARNLPFTEFTADTLSDVIPAKDTKIVIYCNNNFEGSPAAFASKGAMASLNLSTFTSLKAYGYENVYELGPLLNVQTTRIPFEGREVGR